MKNFWKLLRKFGGYFKYILPLVGFLAIAAKYIEGFLKFLADLNRQNTPTADRDVPVGVSDGQYTQPEATSSLKKPKNKPKGTTPDKIIKLEVEGVVKKASSTSQEGEKPTDDILDETRKYLEGR